MRKIRLELAVIAAVMIATAPAIAQTSSNSKWFVPKTASQTAPPPAAPKAAPAPAAAASTDQVGLPALPALPQIAPGTTPPAAVIGVLDISGVLRSSTAYQTVQKVMQTRQDKLTADAQQEQAKWREMNQQITDQQKTLTAEAFAAKQAALQDEISNVEKEYKARDQRNQDAANYAYAEINQVLQSIVGQVAQSRNMNMILSQTQVVLNIGEFNISAQVAAELNQVLPSVLIPPDGADVASFARAHEVKTGR